MNPLALVRDHLLTPAGARASAELVRYGVVASLGYVLAVALYGLQLALGVPEYPAVAVVFVLNGLFNFMGVRLWAFPPSGKRAHHDLGRFAVVAAASLVINTARSRCFSRLPVRRHSSRRPWRSPSLHRSGSSSTGSGPSEPGEAVVGPRAPAFGPDGQYS
jgi:putative flippase GtrA